MTIIRWVLFGSYAAFNLLMISLLWRDHWLPRDIGIAILVFIVVCWIGITYFLFRYFGMTLRQKACGWIFFAGIVGYTIARRFSSYHTLHDDSASWILWTAIPLSVLLSCVTLASLVLRGDGRSKFNPTAPYTVESETPDHVAHVDQ